MLPFSPSTPSLSFAKVPILCFVLVIIARQEEQNHKESGRLSLACLQTSERRASLYVRFSKINAEKT